MASVNVADVVSALKTFLEGLSWASNDGGGTTSFQAVYTYPNWMETVGYPFAVITDSQPQADLADNKHVAIEPH